MSAATAEELADRIRTLLARDRPTRALAASARLVELAPDDLEALRLRGTCLMAAGQWERAAQHWRRLLERRPGDPELTTALARSQIEADEHEAALGTLDELAAETFERLGLRARALTALGRFDEAVDARRRAADRRPGDPSATAEEARALARAGDTAAASALLATVDGHAPGVAAARREVVGRLRGAAGIDAWWADAGARGDVPPELVLDALRERVRAGDPQGALERYAALAGAPTSTPVATALSDAIMRLRTERPSAERLRALLAQADPQTTIIWTRTIDVLVKHGGFDAARELVAALPDRDRLPQLRERVAALLAQLPGEDDYPPELARLARTPEILITRSPGATALVVVLGPIPSRLLHGALARRGVDLVHLHDRRDLNYLDGLTELGGGWDGMVSALRELATADGPRRVVTVGSSGAGYTAARLGIDLGADAVLALSPPTDLRPETRRSDGRANRQHERIAATVPELVGDLRPVLEAAPAPPAVHVWFGDATAQDRSHALRLGGAPGVVLHPVSGGARHNVLLDMLRLGLVDGCLDELLAETVARR